MYVFILTFSTFSLLEIQSQICIFHTVLKILLKISQFSRPIFYLIFFRNTYFYIPKFCKFKCLVLLFFVNDAEPCLEL